MFVASFDYIIKCCTASKIENGKFRHRSLDGIFFQKIFLLFAALGLRYYFMSLIQTCQKFAYVSRANVCPSLITLLQKLYELIYKFQNATNDTNHLKPEI